ncbi:MAG: PIN domain nuclease [Desulfobacterales bacterium]
MILVDSSVWIGYFNGKHSWQTDSLNNLLSKGPVIMGDLILTEVLQGFRADRDFNAAKLHLDALPFRSMGGYEVALKSARNYRLLRKKGVTVRKTIDVIIATFCIIDRLTLLHEDRDFDPMVVQLSLQVLRPSE